MSDTPTPDQIELLRKAFEIHPSHWTSEEQDDVNEFAERLIAALSDARTKAARYDFLKPFLATDGDVDDEDMATRFFQWLKIDDEHIDLPDAYSYASVDEAIDAAIKEASGT